MFKAVHRTLLHQFADSLQDDPRALPNLKLAAMIASGEMHKEMAMYTLMRLLGEKADKMLRGKVRTNTSSLVGVTAEDMSECTFMLASTLKDKGSMTKFGSNPKTLPGAPLSHPRLPNFYNSHYSPTVIQGAMVVCLRNLGVLHTRMYVIAHDDCVFKQG